MGTEKESVRNRSPLELTLIWQSLNLSRTLTKDMDKALWVTDGELLYDHQSIKALLTSQGLEFSPSSQIHHVFRQMWLL